MKFLRDACLCIIILFCSSCVKSNLDNVFDPTAPFGLIIGLSINTAGGSSGAESSTSGSTGTLSNACSRTPTVTTYDTAGTYSYNVPSDASSVFIEVIGGGGGGAIYGLTVDASSFGGFDGGDSFVSVSGGSELVRATGGGGGVQGVTGSTVGTGGSAGSPGGVAGGNGWTTGGGSVHDPVQVPGADLPGSTNGDGGPAEILTAIACCQGGGSGGSGGRNSITETGLAGVTLDVTVGARGTNGWWQAGKTASTAGTGYGETGRVIIIAY